MLDLTGSSDRVTASTLPAEPAEDDIEYPETAARQPTHAAFVELLTATNPSEAH